MYSNNIYNKDIPRYISFLDSLKYNKLFYITYTILFFVIGLLTNDFAKTMFTAAYMPYHAYFMHIIGHKINPFKYLHGIHHTKEINHKWYNEILEFILNLVFIGGGIIIPLNIYLNRYNISLLNNYGILAFTLLYTTHHMINYHYLTIHTHVNHHELDLELGIQDQNKLIRNYGPDTIDAIFGTKNDGEEYEDMRFTSINNIVIMVVIYYIYNTRYDIIRMIKNKLQ